MESSASLFPTPETWPGDLEKIFHLWLDSGKHFLCARYFYWQCFVWGGVFRIRKQTL